MAIFGRLLINSPQTRSSHRRNLHTTQAFTCALIGVFLLNALTLRSEVVQRNAPLASSNQRISVTKDAHNFGDTSFSYTASSSSRHHHIVPHPASHSDELNTVDDKDDDGNKERIGIADHQLAQIDANTHVYTNQFVIESDAPLDQVKRLANEHGFDYLGHMFDKFHHLKHRKIVKRCVDRAHERHHAPLNSHPLVLSLQQQKLKRRTKRDFLNPSLTAAETRSSGHEKRKSHVKKQSSLPYYSSTHHRHFQQSHPPLLPFASAPQAGIEDALDNRVKFDDPQWPRMWYLNRGNGYDMNVEDAWSKNITGRNVVVTILDDGLEKDHPDLVTNYDPKASTDINGLDEDPMPRYDIIDSNRHGTRCAGEVAANANNSVCAVGVAFNANVGGIRMLDGDVTDAVEARSLSFNPDHIDIYSASWGPDDDGRTVDGPGELAAKAFENGIKKGRRGKGSIFVWASGNGGREKDNCNCDGYTNSIWTLSISSATEKGMVPWYSEACSSTLATTYSSGSSGERQIVTTDLHHGCTASHTGTSASAPIAAGICALALEANSFLTWRDMQHIVVLTAKPKNLYDKDWVTNGVGRNVSHWFGYGLLDASAMVDYARDWQTVPQQKQCETYYKVNGDRKILAGKTEVFTGYEILNCNYIGYIEHVQVKVNLTAPKRGDIEIRLTSPAGTTSTLLALRPMDNSRTGFLNWPFMTVHMWSEQPRGRWNLTVINHGRSNNVVLQSWSLVLYGTTENPYAKSFMEKFHIRQTHPNQKTTINPHQTDNSRENDPRHLSDNRIDGNGELAGSPSANTASTSAASSSATGNNNNNHTKIIFVDSFNNSRDSSPFASAYSPSPPQISPKMPFDRKFGVDGGAAWPDVPRQNIDGDYDRGEFDHDSTQPNTGQHHQSTPYGRHHTHHSHTHTHHQHHQSPQYVPNVERQTDGHKFYSPHQRPSTSYPSAPYGISASSPSSSSSSISALSSITLSLPTLFALTWGFSFSFVTSFGGSRRNFRQFFLLLLLACCCCCAFTTSSAITSYSDI